MEAIVKRTGVAKTTVYRHWPSRDDLIIAIIAESAFALPRPNTGDPIRDVREILLAVWGAMVQPATRGAFASVIESSASNRNLAFNHRAFLDTRTAPLKDAVTAVVSSGLLPDNTDIDLTCELLAAPVIVRGFVMADPVDPQYVDGLMDRVLGRARI